MIVAQCKHTELLNVFACHECCEARTLCSTDTVFCMYWFSQTRSGWIWKFGFETMPLDWSLTPKRYQNSRVCEARGVWDEPREMGLVEIPNEIRENGPEFVYSSCWLEKPKQIKRLLFNPSSKIHNSNSKAFDERVRYVYIHGLWFHRIRLEYTVSAYTCT